MLQKEELNALIAENGLIGIETLSNLNTKNSIEVNSAEELIALAKLYDAKAVFYDYMYPLHEIMYISEDDILGSAVMDKASAAVLTGRIEEYNERVEKIDSSRPIGLSVFFPLNGYLIFCDEIDTWYVDEGFDFPEQKLREFVAEAEDEIRIEREKTRLYFEKIKEALREKLLHDKDFHGCTNRYLRNQYINRNFGVEERRLFLNYDDHLEMFVESVWKEYKANKRFKGYFEDE